MDRVKFGCIGLGGIAEQVHLPGLKNSLHAEIYAICDKDRQRLADIGERYGIPSERRFENYEEMISLSEVDAIDITTPNFMHYEPAMMAFKHKKAVCIEKPLAMDYKEALEMERAATAADVPTMVCFSYRFYAPFRFAKWIISNGFIGDVLNVYIQHLKSSAFIENRPLEWRFQKALAGSGVLGDLGAHMLDTARFLAGEITAVCAQTSIAVRNRKKIDSEEMAQVNTDDACDVLAKIENDALASISVSRCAVGNDNNAKVVIYGNKGMIGIDSNRLGVVEVCSGKLDFSTGSIHEIKVPKSFYAEQMDTFARSIKGKTDEFMPVIRDGLICQKIIDTMIVSDENMKWVNV